jgi:5'-3' exonuclease
VNLDLLDGTYELFRAYYGGPSARAGRKEVGAVRTMVRSWASWLRNDRPTHVACAFDHVVESFRNELFDGYKTGEGIDPDLYGQFELAELASSAIGFVTWPMIEFEADDALASGAVMLAGRGRTVRIGSPDKDLLQCVVGRDIVAYDRWKKEIRDEDGVVEKLGVPPRAIPDYLALVGDPADGIPGVPRWGAKSASVVLARYGSLEAIPRDALEWDVKVRGAAALADSLRMHEREVVLYRTLATLRTDVALDRCSVDDLAWRGPNPERVRELGQALDADVASWLVGLEPH